MRNVPARILILGAALVVAATTAALAFPGSDPRPLSSASSSYQADEAGPVAPILGLALVGVAAREVATDVGISPTTVAPSASVALTTTSLAPRTHADHLASETPDPKVPPAQVVTTTVPPPPPPPPPAPPAAPAPPPTTVPAVTVAFTATQAYGSCSEPIPYDIFSGQATPGTTVSIRSPYGSGSTTVDANGHWEKTVQFPGAPRGEAFGVTASGLGGSTTLSFTATA